MQISEGHFITEENLDKSIDDAYIKGYNEAVDDCVRALKVRRDTQYMKVNCDDIELKILSEQLKESCSNAD